MSQTLDFVTPRERDAAWRAELMMESKRNLIRMLDRACADRDEATGRFHDMTEAAKAAGFESITAAIVAAKKPTKP